MTPDFSREPAMPDGWPIGSYNSYRQAVAAVDHLVRSDFPVRDVAIVGVDPVLVERVEARQSLRRVVGAAAVSGVWLGLFAGLTLSLFTVTPWPMPMLIGLVAGVGVATAMAASRYAGADNRHDFTSHSSIVANRYDVVCAPRTSERGRELLAALSLKGAV